MSIIQDVQKIEDVLSRGVENVYPTKEAVKEALMSGRKLRLYFGIDPTSPLLHIGHAIGLRKMRAFQDLGHEVIILFGSFTAMIGDPTDKSAARVQLSADQVLENAKTYKKQAKKILRFSGENAAKIMFNHKWLAKLSFEDVVHLAQHFTVQQMSERDMFAKRILEGKPVHLHEFLYPLMQGYDSVAMDVDMEVGGSDQIFNMLAGRTLMSKMKQKEKFVVALRLLTNDEGKKMSKTEGGFIAVTDAPEDMFGKIMAMSDSMILPYFEIATDVSMEEIVRLKKDLEGGANPRDIKEQLAMTVVSMFHTKAAAKRAARHFDRVFRSKAAPEEMEEYILSGSVRLIDVLVASGLASSKSEARRLLEQKAVKVDGEIIQSEDHEVKKGTVLQKGKRHFVKLV